MRNGASWRICLLLLLVGMVAACRSIETFTLAWRDQGTGQARVRFSTDGKSWQTAKFPT